jgi:hypothetical protein
MSFERVVVGRHCSESPSSIHIPSPRFFGFFVIKEVIGSLTELLAALSHNDIDGYLESFFSDDDESCSSDVDDFDDHFSEEEDEVGAVVDNDSH